MISDLILNDKRYKLGNFIKDDKNKIIFYLHQKCGNTSFLKMIFENLGILELALSYDKYRKQPIEYGVGWPHYYRYSVYNIENRVTVDNIISGEYKLIKIVRNPYKRIVSSYLHVSKVNKELLNKHFKNDNLSFYEFLLILKNKNLKSIDLHIDEQICLFEKENMIYFDEIIKIEELKDKINYLNDKYNLNMSFFYETIHKQEIKQNKINNFIGKHKYDQYKNSVPEYKYFYNDEIREIVYELFKDDINYYNYSYDL